MLYTDATWTGTGYVGRICADAELAAILHETDDVYPTEGAAEFAAWLEWSAWVDEPTMAAVEEALATDPAPVYDEGSIPF